MGVREIDRFLEQWQIDARDLHRRIILSPTPLSKASINVRLGVQHKCHFVMAPLYRMLTQ